MQYQYQNGVRYKRGRMGDAGARNKGRTKKMLDEAFNNEMRRLCDSIRRETQE